VSAFAAQTTASSSLMQFNYDNVLKWTFGIETSPAIWICIFMIYMISVNLLPVRVCVDVQDRPKRATRADQLAQDAW
jgi:amino acid permease